MPTLDERIEAALGLFPLTGDARLTRRCATKDCGCQPTYRFEAGGVGSDYCSGCAHKLVDVHRLALDLATERARLLAEIDRLRAAEYCVNVVIPSKKGETP